MEGLIDMGTKIGLLILIFLLAFILTWIYTEVTEQLDRDRKWDYIESFVLRGERFTKDDGDRLKSRVMQLEREICRIDPNCVVKN